MRKIPQTNPNNFNTCWKKSRTNFSILDEKDSFLGNFYIEAAGTKTISVKGLTILEALRGKKIATSIRALGNKLSVSFLVL